MQALKEKVLSSELIEEVGVDDENCIAEDVAENWADDENPPAMPVGPRSSKKGKQARKYGLDDTVVHLQLWHILLH